MKKKALINEACFEARKLAKDLFASIASHGLQHIWHALFSFNRIRYKGEDPTCRFLCKIKV